MYNPIKTKKIFRSKKKKIFSSRDTPQLHRTNKIIYIKVNNTYNIIITSLKLLFFS